MARQIDKADNAYAIYMMVTKSYVLTFLKFAMPHPHDLKIAGDWAGFMQLLYQKKLVQLFKQVIREYYPITEDELQERTISRRYAGHQVQPQRTVALLKSRGWTVDTEASHSTVEMRVAIAAELAKLLKLSNVSWIGSHAKIQGKLASYSVHMGSGIVHAEGVGMVSILPVHSQSRGRIFLPFTDDDPKTAEIMSKISLLSEDSKIKDPTILSQLSG